MNGEFGNHNSGTTVYVQVVQKTIDARKNVRFCVYAKTQVDKKRIILADLNAIKRLLFTDWNWKPQNVGQQAI